VANANTT
jgi:hypothetical protein